MEMTIEQSNRGTRIALYLSSSLIATSFLFFADSDISEGFSKDTLIASIVFIALFTSSQLGVSKLIGKHLDGWSKLFVSMIGGLLTAFVFYVSFYSILYLIKF